METEIGDAGALPTSAQVTVGTGSLDSISGNSDSAFDDVDMYKIYIDDLSLFSAATNNAGTSLFDPMLFLFDSAGNGIGANDDTDFFNLQSTIPTGSLVGGPGFYYLAISLFPEIPFDSAINEIFPDILFFPDSVVAADPAAGAVDSWDFDFFPDPFFAESYRIDLTGAQFAEQSNPQIPEPTSVFIWSIVLFIGSCSQKVLRRICRPSLVS